MANQKTNPHQWTPERHERMAAMFAAGISLGEIARVFTADYGIPYSRSAVAGRAWRAGMLKTRVAMTTGGKKIQNDGRLRSRGHKRKGFVDPAPEVAIPAPTETLEWPDHQDAHGCRYVHGDVKTGAWRYCQEPTKNGSPYCETHHARCRFVPQTAHNTRRAVYA